MTDWEFTKWLWGLLVPYGIYLHRKIDKTTEESVKRSEFNSTVQSVREDIRRGNEQITSRLDQLLQSLLDKK